MVKIMDMCCVTFHLFSPFFFSPCGYFNILLEYSVKLRMHVIDIPYVTLSMRSKHIRDVTALQSAARGVSTDDRNVNIIKMTENEPEG